MSGSPLFSGGATPRVLLLGLSLTKQKLDATDCQPAGGVGGAGGTEQDREVAKPRNKNIGIHIASVIIINYFIQEIRLFHPHDP